MPESGTYGSVRGVPGNGHPYRKEAIPPIWQLRRQLAAQDQGGKDRRASL